MKQLIEKKSNTINRMERLEEICNEANIQLAELKYLKEVFNRQTFDIALVGEFTSGKSTIINALFEKDFLPTHLTPTTAKITNIEFADNFEFTLNMSNGTTLNLSDEDVLKKYRVQTEEQLMNVKDIDVKIPSPLLEQGVKIIDTPGINDTDESRVQLTYNLLPKIDAIIYVLTYPITNTNIEIYKENIKANGFKSVHFLLNKIDLFSSEEIEIIKGETESIFSETTDGKVSVMFISALDYIQGRELKDDGLIKKSNFLVFAEFLNDLLTSSKKFEIKEARQNLLIDKIKNQMAEIIDFKIDALQNPNDMSEKRKNDIYDEITKFVKGSEELTADVISEYDRLLNKLNVSLRNMFDEILETLELSFSQPGADTEYLIKSCEILIKNKFETWKNRNQNPVIKFIESINDEINLRLGHAYDEVRSTTIRKYYEAPGVKSDFKIQTPLSGFNDKKASLYLSTASLSGYALLATAGFTFAPIAMLIIPFGIYKIHQMKAEEHARIKNELLSTLSQNYESFKEEVFKSIVSFRDNCLSEIRNAVLNYKNSMERALKDIELEISKEELIRKNRINEYFIVKDELLNL